VLAWLNSDDTFSQAFRRRMPFCKPSEAGMVYGMPLIDKTESNRKFPAADGLPPLRRGYVHIPQQSSFFRASLWQQVAPLDPSFFLQWIMNLWVRGTPGAALLPATHLGEFGALGW